MKHEAQQEPEPNPSTGLSLAGPVQVIEIAWVKIIARNFLSRRAPA